MRLVITRTETAVHKNMTVRQTWGLGAAALPLAFCCDFGSLSVSLSWTSCDAMHTWTQPRIFQVRCSAGHDLPDCTLIYMRITVVWSLKVFSMGRQAFSLTWDLVIIGPGAGPVQAAAVAGAIFRVKESLR